MPSEHGIHLHLYGIRNCDSCRKALRWLQNSDVPHSFHDIREENLSRNVLQVWLKSAHGPSLVNRRSTTWRQLSDAERQSVERDAATLIMQHPTLMKRPVITDGEAVLDVGFEASRLAGYI